MIISRIEGGLGNQMFQYAYGLYLARKHQTQLWLDTGSYATYPQHGFLLDRFELQAEVLPAKMRNKVPRRYRAADAGRRRSIPDWMRLGLRRHKQKEFGFRAEHLNVPDNRYLVGYWQSERFFPGMRRELLEHFRLSQPAGEQTRRIADRMQETSSVAVHVRRGDYLAPDTVQLYEQLSLDYYQRCLRAWAEGKANVEVFVFSNDMAWCREQLKWPWKTHWMVHNDASTAHEDLWLMSRAACCVIANSTFSWWAAWLNPRPDKRVYAPTGWFRPGKLDDADIIPSTWIKERSAALSEAA